MTFENNPQSSIICPKCGTTIDVNNLLHHKIEKELQQSFNNQLAQLEKELQQSYNNQSAQLEAERQRVKEQSSLIKEKQKALEEQKRVFEDEVKLAVKELLKIEKQKQESQLRASIAEEMAEEHKAIEKELKDKTEQLKELYRAKADVARLMREKDMLKSEIEAQAEQQINERLKEEVGKIQKSAEERVQFKLSEKDNLIEELKKQIQEVQRKADQGSIQRQGEIQELAIEEWLRLSFLLDTILEIKKGVRGADCLHIVNTRNTQNCGSIYYESKRTKDFQPSWIEKFKDDLRSQSANIGVIVTEAMPKDMERMGLKDGIWICSFEEFKGLSAVLRESIVQINNAVVINENKGDKMNMLYSYLTSNEFKLQIEAIVEGFTQMQIDLNAEKRAIESAWKKREKQIDKVLLNTNHLYSSIKGIAGSAIAAIPQLELSNN
ncbi:MAG: DUF2130 domain-containing protein [Desulfamplus sp.]|nr:DUF2130 domain-containing protein [Desulfamplus sp.]MBF0389103.1 DUF2130 domain-containing protein [Desulfamplus sp.]